MREEVKHLIGQLNHLMGNADDDGGVELFLKTQREKRSDGKLDFVGAESSEFLYDLSMLDLSNADFEDFIATDEGRAHFSFSFSGSNLACSSFRGASLRHCDFSDANLEDADMYGASLADCIIAPAQLASTKQLEFAFLPPGMFADAVAAGYVLMKNRPPSS